QQKSAKLLKEYEKEKTSTKTEDENQFILVSQEGAFHGRIEKMIKNSQTRICLMAPQGELIRFLDRHSEILKEALQKNVNIKIITEQCKSQDIIKKELGLHKLGNLEIRCTTILPAVSFDIFDEKEILLQTTAKPNYEESGVVWSNNSCLIELAQNYFNAAWFSAIEPLDRSFRPDKRQFEYLFDNLIVGFAYCKMEFDIDNKPVDFIYLQVNDAFEAITGLRRQDVVGKRATKAIPGIELSNPELFEIYGRVCLTGKGETFELFFKPFSLWLSISVYSPERGHFAAVFENITERKKTEEQVKRSEEKYRRLFESANDGIILSSEDGTLISANNAAAKILGYESPQDLLRTSVYERYENAADRKLLTERLFKENELKNLELKLRKKNGTQIDLLCNSVIIEDPTSKMKQILTVFTDITEHKKAELKIRESEEKFRRAFEMGPDAFSISTLDKSSIIDANDQFLEMFGYTREEVVGKSAEALGIWADISDRQRMVDLLKSEGTVANQELLFKRKNGEVFPVVFSASLLHMNYRTLVLIASKDISKRKSCEEALKQSEKNYRNLINGMNDSAWVIDSSRNFVEVNDAAVNALGYSREELLQLGIGDIDKHLSKEEGKEIRDKVYGKGLQVFETVHTTKDGREIPVEISSTSVTYNGKQFVLSIARNITERKKAAMLLEKSEKKYKNLFEESLQGTLIMRGPVPRIIYANKIMINFLGYSLEELTAMSPQQIYSLVHPDDRKPFFARFQERFEGKPRQGNFEGRGIRKDGTQIWLEAASVKVEYEGQPAVQATFLDITARKEAELQLEKSEQKYRQLASNAPTAIYEIDCKTGQFKNVNYGMSKLTGYSEKELLSMNPFDLLDSESKEVFRDRLKKGAAGEEISEKVEYTAIRKDGAKRLINITTKLTFENNKLDSAFVVANDVTEVKKAEAELIKKELMYQTLFENNLDGIIVGRPDGKILEANPAICKMLGMNEQEVIAKGRQGIVINDRRNIEALKERDNKGKVFAELTFKRKDGSTFDAEISSTYFKDVDGLPAVLVTVREIRGP
ncbi:MAG TPA: PAS domain S-box protein, partial [Candidatus Nanoarchaeia archaeon]|nr:PAS domain S-box protein [Candidatus Nanoarchaeia archaeon]